MTLVLSNEDACLLQDEATTFFEFYHSNTLNAHVNMKEVVIQIFKIDSG